jgi:hypothetical protein
MKSIKTRSLVGKDGILRLDIPIGVPDTEFEVMVIYQPIESSRGVKTPEELGWTPGFFEQTAGCLADDPIFIDDEGDFEERERIYKGRFEELRGEIMVGVEASERGEVVDGEIVFSQLQQKLQQLRDREGE